MAKQAVSMNGNGPSFSIGKKLKFKHSTATYDVIATESINDQQMQVTVRDDQGQTRSLTPDEVEAMGLEEET